MFSTSTLSDLIFNSLKFISEEKYQEASDNVESILNNNNYVCELNTYHWQCIADIYLALGRFETAKDAYFKANNMVGVAFTLILMGSLDDANSYLQKVNKSPAKMWCEFLIDIFTEKPRIKSWPSFLQIRHFLEFTVYYLLLSKQYIFIDLLVKSLKKLLDLNMDSEKYIGYAYLSYGDVDQALKYMNSSIKRNKLDGELYFMLGKAHIMKNNFQGALSMLENAKSLLPNHYPTRLLLEHVKQKL